MAMQITENKYLSFLDFRNRGHDLLKTMNGRMEQRIRISPSAIQINPRKGSAIVSTHNSINIEHWYYFKDIKSSEILGSL